MTATLTADGDGTAVTVVTDLTITGKVAQFGRGVLADVSGKLIGQFVENLERDVLTASEPSAPAPGSSTAGTPAATTPASTNGSPGPRRIEAPEVAPVDLLATAGSPVAKRALPAAAIVGVLVVFLWRRARRRARR